MLEKKPTLIFMTCGLFLLLDQILKWQALHGWRGAVIFYKFFGWYPFLNPGIAFSLPAPNWLIVGLSIPVIGLMYFLSRAMYYEGRLRQAWALAFIFTGALSNLADRIVYQHTVDYVRLFTGVVNVADGLILFGFAMYFFNRKSLIFK